MGGEFGGEWIHVYVRLSPFTVHLKLSAVPQYKIKSLKLKKKKYEFCFSAELSEMIADMIIVPKSFLIADLSIPIYVKGNLVSLFLKCVYALTECCLLTMIFVSKESVGP